MHHTRFIAVALLGASGAALAGRPLQAEDAGVIDLNGCEVEGAHSHWRQDGESQRQSYLQLGCGVAEGSEVALQLLRPRELALGGKTQLGRLGEAQFTLAWSLAHRHLPQGWRHSGTGATLVASAPWGQAWQLHANLGHLRDERARQATTTWALAAEHNGLGEDGRWQPMAEVYGDDRGQPWLNAALRLTLVPGRAFVDASLGRQLGGTRARLATAGFKFAF